MTTLKQDKYEGLGNGPWNEGYFPTAKQECIWNIPEDKRHCEFCTANCNKVPTISTTTAQTLEQAAGADVAEVFERMELTGEYVYTPTAQSIARGRFKAGAEWTFKQFSDILDKWEEHAIRGMRVGASAYHQGKIALICDLRDWMKEQTKK